MSSLKECLSAWAGLGLDAPSTADLQLTRAAAAASMQLAAAPVELPDAKRLSEIAIALIRAFRRRELNAVPRRWRRDIPWALCAAGAGDGQRPLDQPGLLDWYLSIIRDAASRRLALNLAAAYLLYFEPGNPAFGLLGRQVRELLRRATSPRTRRWLERSEQYGLFEENGSSRLVDRWIAAGDHAEHWLGDAGLTGALAAGGFALAAYDRFLERLPALLGRTGLTEEECERLLGFALAESGELRFAGQRVGALANAVLTPFTDHEPESAIRERIKGLMLEHLGDPRLKPHAWQNVRASALQVMRRWLVQSTLEDFFGLLDYNARYDDTADRHWRYRRAFWTAYLRHNQITESWVALGYAAASRAKAFLSSESVNYARLAGGPVKPDHAVLVLKIGSLVISEWSHMGKYRLWHESSPGAPVLYLGHYSRYDLTRQPDFEGSHMGAANGRWQEKLQRYIREQTGFRLSRNEYMAGRR